MSCARIGRESPTSSKPLDQPEIMRRICVYCASNLGVRDAYAEAARELAGVLVEDGYELVYGGSSTGVMGVLADAVLQRGGTVHGVIPELLLEKEISHQGLSELHVVKTMHERKSLMESLSDGFVALPGGFGTLEELIEILTWGQLHIHAKPVGVLNVAGFFDGLVAYLDHAVAEGLLPKASRDMLHCASDSAALIEDFKRYQPPTTDKWM
jgi:uncharacterized protein (TIGR00730 family)